jgi:hypothetical protein
MEIARKEFNRKIGGKVNIYFLGDIHEGNCNHAEAELKEAVNIIRDDPDGYWLGMGDYIEAINSKDPRFNPIEIAELYKMKDLKDLPRKQADNVYRKLKPIEDKCLALMIGNHEEMYMRHNGFDVYDHFRDQFTTSAHQPGHAPPKLGYVGFYRVVLVLPTEKCYKVDIALNHGIGGGGYREGYPINKVHDCFRWVDAEIMVMGHIHALVEDSKKIQGVNLISGLSKRERFYGASGCFLWTFQEGKTNYFEHKGKNESDIGMLKAEITQRHGRHNGPIIKLEKIKLG